ncbi:MAG: hypothetical protein UU74_C0033G0021 [Candidatus Woesebacteria bacterium GW2011_GWA1_41_7]|uniref:Uncharacterized protein n=1 Tax=Candidatus Woesebacteria bacterium GW2011_GWA1_41_7 TaxID=1618556 RepID=A0A0G0WVK8_9BACT|nr:MAG: hypothetical protein UU74_C0033G0021 [Candidatus Woesebacteria bacterium GW2011_GWA1_41_7]
MAFKDRRRNDVRDNIQGRTVWITSAEINIADVGAGTTVLFSFPKANETYIIDKCALDVLTDLDAGTVTIGHGSLPLDTTAESGTLTTTSATSLWDTDNGDETTGTIFNIDDQAPIVLVGAASTVPVIIATIATAATGRFRVHLRITALPSYS